MSDVRLLNLQLEAQQKSLFCWAAVCVSLIRYYEPDRNMDQENFAAQVTGHSENRALSAREALKGAGILKGEIDGPLSLERIKEEIDKGQPIAAELRFFVGGHLVVITGYKGACLSISDPLFGDSKYDHELFTQAYRGGGYTWTTTYLTSHPSDAVMPTKAINSRNYGRCNSATYPTKHP